MSFKVQFLGQSSLRFEYGDLVIYCDPYFSHQVEKLEGPDLKRQVPIPLNPETIKDANWIFISHDHLDHLDLETLLPLAQASPQAQFLAPRVVIEKLSHAGLPRQRLHRVEEKWMDLTSGLRVHGIAAAHPEVHRDEVGGLKYCGFVLEAGSRRAYFSGDTSPCDEMIKQLKALTPIHVVFLPVNERNYFKDKAGIIGNMTLREAFGIAGIIKAETLVPLHWDMFKPNSVFKEEIELVYQLSKKSFDLPFELEMDPKQC